MTDEELRQYLKDLQEECVSNNNAGSSGSGTVGREVTSLSGGDQEVSFGVENKGCSLDTTQQLAMNNVTADSSITADSNVSDMSFDDESRSTNVVSFDIQNNDDDVSNTDKGGKFVVEYSTSKSSDRTVRRFDTDVMEQRRRTFDIEYTKTSDETEQRRTFDVEYTKTSDEMEQRRRTFDVEYTKTSDEIKRQRRSFDVQFTKTSDEMEQRLRTFDVEYSTSNGERAGETAGGTSSEERLLPARGITTTVWDSAKCYTGLSVKRRFS